jgi:syntaxin 5
VAKRKSLFDDPTIEIQELTSIINQDIKNLNNQISVLQQRGSERQNKQIQQHSDTVLDSLKSKLRDATKDFTEVLELRTEVVLQINNQN